VPNLRNPGSRSRRSRRRSRTRGQALVEFALVLPAFLLVLSGILDFGFLLYSRMTVINAAREGARQAIIASDPTTIPSVAKGKVLSMSTGLVVGNIGINTACVAIATPGSCSFATSSSSQAGDAVSVGVVYTYHTFFPLLFGQTVDLGSTVQMVRE
jgi:Flp pilus assembly protein TadG